ncbi:beta-ketoacyl-ACP synthase [Basilea psittacipulmonis]|uniref:Ketosynthase family 3 (KS3) domain-containing protein n=1 Tax=Basilea psittacipulmonis DSM 24701 TaxID=1072685 RepID=A0A077DEL1_9BURK|nr:beta-ketoacyl-ACP synthase [Basilea psittacipulmonis]AIL33270.1 hypothetical protein IX83_08140 [Basilea psittacipulmonis DSM 24701]
MTVYLHKPSVISPLGRGLDEHIRRLLDDTKSPLSFSQDWIQDKNIMVGKAPYHQPFPDHTPDIHRTYNNQLLWNAVIDIKPEIDALIQEYESHRIGIVVGTTNTGIENNIKAFDQYEQHQSWEHSGYVHDFQLLSSPANFLSQMLEISGPSYVISTACTSSAKALISGKNLIESGICDAVICAGVDVLSRLSINGFHSLEALSKGQNLPFSKDRDGINIGEAAVVFILSKKSSGMALLGDGGSSDGYHMSSPCPQATGAILAIQEALNKGHLNPNDIAWINLHGTGTQLNDSMESHAIHEIFGDQIPCTSTKYQTGHTLGAAGALEAAFVWGVMDRTLNPEGKIPNHVSCEYDPNIDQICLAHQHYLPSNQARIGLSASFAFGGSNAILIIGEPQHA